MCEGAHLYVGVPQKICDWRTKYFLTCRHQVAPLGTWEADQLAAAQQGVAIVTPELNLGVQDAVVGRYF